MSLKLADIREFDKLDFLAKQLVEGFITGLHKSPFHGFSVEFAEHKVYNSGESTRHVDWKVFARTDRLYTKQYEEETNLRCQILLDVSGSMYYPEPSKDKIRFAALTTAALAHLLSSQRDAVGVTLFSNKIEHQTPQSSTASNLNLVFKVLDNAIVSDTPKGETRVDQVIHEIAEKLPRRSLVIILSDMFQATDDTEAIFKSLQHLKHKKHEILLFHVTDRKTELEFDFEDRPYQFVDLETKQSVKLNPRDVKEQYFQRTEQLYRELKLKCGQYKIDFIEADVSEPFDKVLSAYLIKRKRMK